MKTHQSESIKALPDATNTGQLVDGEKLLEIIFEAKCRPSKRWLCYQQKRRAIPFCKIGRLVFFDPQAVKAALAGKHTIKCR